eukprot:1873664-Prymnesium_polylepis.2
MCCVRKAGRLRPERRDATCAAIRSQFRCSSAISTVGKGTVACCVAWPPVEGTAMTRGVARNDARGMDKKAC